MYAGLSAYCPARLAGTKADALSADCASVEDGARGGGCIEGGVAWAARETEWAGW